MQIRDIARLAGVSPATVSRVINGTAPVDAGTRQRVEQAIGHTGYRPSAIARSLSKHSTRLIGLIIPNTVNPYFSELAQEIEQSARQMGYRVMLSISADEPDAEREAIAMLMSLHADGLVLIGSSGHGAGLTGTGSMPVILLDRSQDLPLLPLISADHLAGGQLAAQTLVAGGCRQIAHIAGPPGLDSARQRRNGFSQACRRLGHEPVIWPGSYDYASGYREAMHLLQDRPGTDGIFAANDLVALAVLRACRDTGRQVPDDVQVIGYDGIAVGQMVTPALTTIVQPISQIGRQAVTCLVGTGLDTDNPLHDRPDHLPGPAVYLPVTVALRETTRLRPDTCIREEMNS